ncbi:MAG: fumarylacetoacetate hydrolase family protein [Bacteroidetes bacterium]|nr:fumarylacetoacetate hydrolase family protein [Bacteroidota bacterium]MBX7239930.1 fumarylacetoacetate hydrolase family protein [Bacteroidia bacterium]MCW5920463.1 fumarylacetoacetate hydrolase family protein [Bacteroidota bacterium]HCI57751.1 fumarylacetoacetate hydrolase [Bacteroidota bacterium]HMU77245.1 fumarylacetoacetate hydrolase family protein [Bacteroidia bacterium]
MKLVTYQSQRKTALGILLNDKVYNLNELSQRKGKTVLPDNMRDFLAGEQPLMETAMELSQWLSGGNADVDGLSVANVNLLAPVPNPTSCRDGYAFRQHVEAARRNRRVEMIPEFDQYPIFYFTNHNAIQGPGDIFCMPDHFEQLDFELEAAIVIGRKGINVKAKDADSYIAGYMIMNDMSARKLQMEEMKLNLGPAKGKDFSTVIGPYLVTPDELASFKTNAKNGHTGNNYNLKMTCKVNGIQVSEGNVGSMDWTFAEIIERCAYGVNILPGDVIGSGTVGTGCFLELNGTGLLNNPDYKPQWLKEGDTVEMEITGLGVLSNTIRKMDSDFSIFALKKM